MASARCPGCGAKNPEEALKCRICGYDLRSQSELPMSQPKAGSEVMKSGSLKGVFALAVLGVVAIVFIGVVLGVLPGGDALTTVRNKVPFLATKSSDGWEEFVQSDARFSATMPVDRQETEGAFFDQWTSTLGRDDAPDTTLAVGWTSVPTPVDEKVDASLTSWAIAWADSQGGKVTSSNETSFQGYPALIVNLEGTRDAAGDAVTIRSLLIRRREQLFVLSSTSVYSDHPQFERLANGFSLL